MCHRRPGQARRWHIRLLSRARTLFIQRRSPGRADIMDLFLSGKRAVVTGGSRGIGFAIADALSAEGAEIALLARDPDRLSVAGARLGERGGAGGSRSGGST